MKIHVILGALLVLCSYVLAADQVNGTTISRGERSCCSSCCNETNCLKASCLEKKIITDFEKNCKDLAKALDLTRLSTGMWYYFETDSMGVNWFDAYAFCNQYGMRLVSIESRYEFQLIAAKIKCIIGSATGVDDTVFWVGLNDQGAEGTFVWATGNQPDSTKFALPWVTGEPDGGTGQNCGMLFQPAVGDLGLATHPCFGPYARFVCEVAPECSQLLNLLDTDCSCSDSCSDPCSNF